MLESRFALSYWAFLLSTLAVTVLAYMEILPVFLPNCEKESRVFPKRGAKLGYRPFSGLGDASVLPQLIVYADDGYNTLMGRLFGELFRVVRKAYISGRSNQDRCTPHSMAVAQNETSRQVLARGGICCFGDIH